MRLRGHSNDGNGAGNGVGVAAASDRGEGEGVGDGCSLTTGLGSGGCAGGEGGKTRVGGLRGVTCVRSRSCDDGVSTPRREGGGGVTAA